MPSTASIDGDGVRPSRIGDNPKVVLVVAQTKRCQALRRAVVRCAPRARVLTTASVLDAMLHMVGDPASLVVLDAAIHRAAAPAMLRQLARIAPSTAVLMLDDGADVTDDLGGRTEGVWPWDEADAALECWRDGRLAKVGA